MMYNLNQLPQMYGKGGLNLARLWKSPQAQKIVDTEFNDPSYARRVGEDFLSGRRQIDPNSKEHFNLLSDMTSLDQGYSDGPGGFNADRWRDTINKRLDDNRRLNSYANKGLDYFRGGN